MNGCGGHRESEAARAADIQPPSSLKAVARVQIPSGLLKLVQVSRLVFAVRGPGLDHLSLVCHWVLTSPGGPERHKKALEGRLVPGSLAVAELADSPFSAVGSV